VERASRRARIGLALWVGLIVFVVVPWYRFQDHSHWGVVQWIPFTTPPIRLRDIVGNLLFYVPFGMLFARAVNRRPGAVVLAGFLLSLATEFTQVFSHGRFPSTTDLICNTLGAWAGALWARSRDGRSSAR
jgi:glycopeptide antibiotics resistance protein